MGRKLYLCLFSSSQRVFEINYACRRIIGYRSDPGAIPGSSTNERTRPFESGFVVVAILNDMKVRDIRGVNLGGWLVLEKWITPSVFRDLQASDEHSLCSELGVTETKTRLEEHRRTFITEKTIRQIQELGLNAVRVPVGYWLFDDVDGYIGGAYRYVDKLFSWAKKYNLQILLCLHGAPGSQNGWDHSGRAGEIGWRDTADNIQRTLNTIERICERYGRREQLFGVELLNEPHPTISLVDLMRYYRKASRVVRKHCRYGVRRVVSDAFRPKQMGRRIFFGGFRHTVLDQHMYQLFTPEDRALDFPHHLKKAREWGDELRRRTRFIPVVVGEWCAVLDGADQSGPSQNHTRIGKEEYVQYAMQQRRSFESAGCGWFYWTALTEDKGLWSLLDHPEFIEK